MGHKLSGAGMRLLNNSEGWHNPAQNIGDGKITIGYGLTNDWWPGLQIGTPAGSPPKGNKAYQRHYNNAMTKFDAAVMDYLNNNPARPKNPNQGQYDALMSFCWNLGTGIFRQYWSSWKSWGMPNAMMKFVNPGSIWEQGLRNRRRREINMYNHGGKGKIGGGGTNNGSNIGTHGGSSSQSGSSNGKEILDKAYKEAEKTMQKIIDTIEDKLSIRQYSLSSEKLGYSVATKQSNWFTTTEVGFDHIKVSFTPDMKKISKEQIDKFNKGKSKLENAISNGSNGGKPNKPSGGGGSSKPSGSFCKKNYDFVKSNLGKGFDMDGMFDYQCFDLVGKLNQMFWRKKGKGWNPATWMPIGMNAKDIPYVVHGNRPNCKETKYTGQKIPAGAVVFFKEVAPYGHVAVQGESKYIFYGQNHRGQKAGITRDALSPFQVNSINYFWH